VLTPPLELHQIFYDDASRARLAREFIPLDNRNSPHPEWYELWPILRFLERTSVRDDTWYGFFSPKFQEKVGISPGQIIEFLQQPTIRAEAVLFSPAWDQICFFRNPWEQGEAWHTGLLTASQQFFDAIGYGLSLKDSITDMSNTVFSNYLVAKGAFWSEWARVARALFDYVQSKATDDPLKGTVAYGSERNQYPMRAFVQERIATAILIKLNFQSLAIDTSGQHAIFTRLFIDNLETRRALQACDLLKRLYRIHSDAQFLDVYEKIRRTISYRPPHPVTSGFNPPT